MDSCPFALSTCFLLEMAFSVYFAIHLSFDFTV